MPFERLYSDNMFIISIIVILAIAGIGDIIKGFLSAFYDDKAILIN